MKAEMDGLKSEEKQRKSDEKFQADSIMMRDAQKQRQKSLASAAQGRSGTILTGPIGITTQANAGTKTLLGS